MIGGKLGSTVGARAGRSHRRTVGRRRELTRPPRAGLAGLRRLRSDKGICYNDASKPVTEVIGIVALGMISPVRLRVAQRDPGTVTIRRFYFVLIPGRTRRFSIVHLATLDGWDDGSDEPDVAPLKLAPDALDFLLCRQAADVVAWVKARSATWSAP